jgi:hypothetical protein
LDQDQFIAKVFRIGVGLGVDHDPFPGLAAAGPPLQSCDFWCFLMSSGAYFVTVKFYAFLTIQSSFLFFLEYPCWK